LFFLVLDFSLSYNLHYFDNQDVLSKASFFKIGNDNSSNSNLLKASVDHSNRSNNVNNHYFNRIRRKIYWLFIEDRKDKYVNFDNYKENWNPDVKVREELKQKILLQKKVLNWLFDRRKS